MSAKKHSTPGNFKNILSLAFTFIFVAGVYALLPDINSLPDIGNINITYLFVAFLLFMLNYTLRTLRIKLLFGEQKTTNSQLFGITCLYGALNYFLPARSGELTYLILTRQHLNTRLHDSSAHLISLRLYDALVLNLSVPFVLYHFGHMLPQKLYYAIAIVMLGINIIALLIIRYALSITNHSPQTNTESNDSYQSRIRRFFQLVRQSLAQTLEPKKQLTYLILSAAIWFAIYAMFSLIAQAFSYPADIPLMAAISLMLFVFSLVPVQGIANIGPHEAAWTLGYSFIGSNSAAALVVSLHTHFVLILFTSALALIGILSLKLHRRKG